MGVTSLMPTTSMPVFWMVRIAVSRPEPGPLTSTSTLRTPCSIARRATVSAASCAANGVLLREPLKPTFPDEAHAMAQGGDSAQARYILQQSDSTYMRGGGTWDWSGTGRVGGLTGADK